MTLTNGGKVDANIAYINMEISLQLILFDKEMLYLVDTRTPALRCVKDSYKKEYCRTTCTVNQ